MRISYDRCKVFFIFSSHRKALPDSSGAAAGIRYRNQPEGSGTSICANVTEAKAGQSRADFLSKSSIALKEAFETAYWLKLLHETGYLSDREFNSIYRDCEEIKRILASIVKTTRES